MTESEAKREIELCNEIYDLSQKVREAGYTDSANGILIEAFAIAKSDSVVQEREHIVQAIQALAGAAMANGFNLAAYNLSSVGLAMLLGEKEEVELGTAMVEIGREHKTKIEKADLMWPDTLD